MNKREFNSKYLFGDVDVIKYATFSIYDGSIKLIDDGTIIDEEDKIDIDSEFELVNFSNFDSDESKVNNCIILRSRFEIEDFKYEASLNISIDNNRITVFNNVSNKTLLDRYEDGLDITNIDPDKKDLSFVRKNEMVRTNVDPNERLIAFVFGNIGKPIVRIMRERDYYNSNFNYYVYDLTCNDGLIYDSFDRTNI